MQHTFLSWFQLQYPHITAAQAEAVLALANEGGTVPFIARYRKEQTKNLDEVGIQAVLFAHAAWEEINKRQAFILEEIAKQGRLTDALKAQIGATFDLAKLEDLYLPYKQKRKTKAGIAREAGLEPLAQWLWSRAHGEFAEPNLAPEIFTQQFISAEHKIADATAALDGATFILTEQLSEKLELRQFVREYTMRHGVVHARKSEKAKPNSKFEMYFAFQESIASLKQANHSHRYLALRRGWFEEELTVRVGGPLDADGNDAQFFQTLLDRFNAVATSHTATTQLQKSQTTSSTQQTQKSQTGSSTSKNDVKNSETKNTSTQLDPAAQSAAATHTLKAARLALKGVVFPSIENEVHKVLRESSDTAAINVFAANVRTVLMASPLGPKAVLGVDPGLRTGCKLAVVDASGRYIASTVMHTQGASAPAQARAMIQQLLTQVPIAAIAVGNGTAGRETERFLRDLLKRENLAQIPVVMVSEAGASIYSASDIAREEFPDLDLTVRGAISIARRLQDPLAELVKTDPKSIGVGQYQHDVAQTQLKERLTLVVDSCVNQVGVNANTASEHLLAHVAGIGPSLAKNIVQHRGKNGLFTSREALRGIPRFSAKAFEQAAGFLRVPESAQPLDNTGVHPERYAALEHFLASRGKKLPDVLGKGAVWLRDNKEFFSAVGEYTARDIVAELEKPGRDPREAFHPFTFRDDIHELTDVTAGMRCPGIVTNVTNFGAFVDIGVHQDGLVHISQLADRFVKDPHDVVKPGQHVHVTVLEVNHAKRQIALSMRSDGASSSVNREREPGRDRSKSTHDANNTVAKKPNAPATPFNNPFAKLKLLGVS